MDAPAGPPRLAVAASVVAVGATVVGIQSAVEWEGGAADVLLMAAVNGTVAALSAWFLHLRCRALADPGDRDVRTIFLPIVFHFALVLGLMATRLPVDLRDALIQTSWVVTQLLAALFLLLAFERTRDLATRRWPVNLTLAILGFGLVVGLACRVLVERGLVPPLDATSVGLAALFLSAALRPLLRPGTVQPRRELWLVAMFLLVALAHLELAWSDRTGDGPYMWGQVVLALGLLAPLVGAVRENVSLVEAQSAMTSRVRTIRSRIEVLLDSLPSLVLSVDRELRLRYANRSAADLLGVVHGMSPDHGTRGWLERLHEADREQVADAVPRLIDAREGEWQGVVRILDLEGTAHWLNLHLHPMVDPVDNRLFVEVVATDVTDLQLARRSSEVRQSRLAFLSNVGQTVAGELAVERLLDRFLVLGREVYPMASLVLYRPVPDRSALRIVAATGRGLDLLQSPDRRTIPAGDHPGWLAFGDGFPRLAAPADIGLTDDDAAELRRQGIRQMLYVPLLAAGVAVGVLGTGVTEGSHLGGDDVDLLTQVGILLGGAIYLADLVRELEEQRAVAIEASRLKSEFLANTSHELRTPLTAILGFLKLLMDGAVEDVDKQRDFLRITHESAEKLLNIINDVLDLAKIEAGRLEVHHAPVPVRRVLSDVEALFRHQMKGRGLDFEIEPAPDALVLWADPDRTTQILTNLLSNALKFTSRGGRVRLRCVEESDTVSFEVVDSGIGIPPDELDRVFDSFYQVDGSSTRQYGGTGLGLTISRRLAEMMGGSLELTSDGVDRGATARLTLRRHVEKHTDAATLQM